MVSPVQSRRLARTLRRWREQAGYSVESAAVELLCGAATVSRMETGGSVQPLRVKAALEMYGAPPELVTEMVEAAVQRRRRGVLRRPYYDFVARPFAEYLDLEQEASALDCVHGGIVPGLLETDDYARAVIYSGEELIEPGEMENYLSLRLARRERLTDENPLSVRAVLGEGVLHTEIGGPEVLADQLRHLIDLAENADNVELRILPFTAGAGIANINNYVILSFPGNEDTLEAEALYIETPLFFVVQDEFAMLSRGQRIYHRIWQASLDAKTSVERMRGAIRRLEGR